MVGNDLFPTPEQIAQDFRDNAPGLTTVTVLQIDPDTGATTETADEVTALKRVHERTSMPIEGGSIPDERCRFWLIAEEVGFTVEAPDRITDEDGITWKVDSSPSVAFGALYRCECTRARS